MQLQSQGIQRLFWSMALVLFVGLLGMAVVEVLMIQPLSQSIEQGVITE